MFIDYAYEIEGPAVVIRGNLQVEFDYTQDYNGFQNHYWVEASAEVTRAVADSAEIVDKKGRVVGVVEVLTESQKARWGAVVLANCQEAIEDACVAAGREQYTRADQYSYTQTDIQLVSDIKAHSDKVKAEEQWGFEEARKET